jgi:hypothetical protein
LELVDELLGLVERIRSADWLPGNGALDRRHHDLLEPHVLRPGDRPLEVVAELGEHEVAAHGLEAVVLDLLAHGLGIVHQAVEFLIERAAWQRTTQLELIDANALQLLEQPDEIAISDHLAMRIGLAADRQAQRVGTERHRRRRKHSRHRRPNHRLLQKLTS